MITATSEDNLSPQAGDNVSTSRCTSINVAKYTNNRNANSASSNALATYANVNNVDVNTLMDVISDDKDDKNDGNRSTKKSVEMVSIVLESETSPSKYKLPLKSSTVYSPPENLSYFKLFLQMCNFGCRAYGGPGIHLAMIKSELIDRDKWMEPSDFGRIYSLYQILPGPETMQLCCFLGFTAKGRLGCLLAGLGYVLPGTILMFIASLLYKKYGLDNDIFINCFKGIQPGISAMIFRAVHKIGEFALLDSHTQIFSEGLFLIAFFSAIALICEVNFFITIPLAGLLRFLQTRENFYHVHIWGNILVLSLFFVSYGLYRLNSNNRSSNKEDESLLIAADNNIVDNSNRGLFITGILAGVLSFGGAYTAVPVVQSICVPHGWINNEQFLDGLAIGSVLPCPTIMFVAFVGIIGNGIIGGLSITIATLLPAFLLCLIGHPLFVFLITLNWLTSILNGIAAAVTGFLAVLAFQLLRTSITDSISAVIFTLSLGILFGSNHKYINVVLVIGLALAGQVLYSPSQ